MGEGTRSGLWTEYAKAINELRPDWVVIENVRGLTSASAANDVEPCPWCLGENNEQHALRALGAVLGDLADLGFDAEWTGIRASDVGAPHGRPRIFILAWPSANTAGRRREISAQLDGDPEQDSANGDTRGEHIARHPRSEVTLLPTPMTVNTTSERAKTGRETSGKSRGGPSFGLEDVVQLLPTPIVSDGTGGPKNLEGARFAPQMREIVQLLPTPDAYAGARGGSQHPDKRRAGNHSVTIQDVAEHQLMPTPRATRGGSATEMAYAMGGTRSDDERPQGVVIPGADWGPYADAITRWEAVIGRPAPSPVRMDGKGGKPRLNPELTEWMMGWPAGHVTDPAIGLSRAEQLKACGNGVVPQQAAAALREMLTRPGVPAVAA